MVLPPESDGGAHVQRRCGSRPRWVPVSARRRALAYVESRQGSGRRRIQGPRYEARQDLASASSCAFVSSFRSVFVSQTRVAPTRQATCRRRPLSVQSSTSARRPCASRSGGRGRRVVPRREHPEQPTCPSRRSRRARSPDGRRARRRAPRRPATRSRAAARRDAAAHPRSSGSSSARAAAVRIDRRRDRRGGATAPWRVPPGVRCGPSQRATARLQLRLVARRGSRRRRGRRPLASTVSRWTRAPASALARLQTSPKLEMSEVVASAKSRASRRI